MRLSSLEDQGSGPHQPDAEMGTICRHDAGRERIELRLDGGNIIGQGCDHKSIIRIDDERRLTFLACFKQIVDLVARPLHATGLEVLDPHQTGKIKHDDQGGEVPIGRGRQTLPGRSCKRQQGQCGDQRSQKAEAP